MIKVTHETTCDLCERSIRTESGIVPAGAPVPQPSWTRSVNNFHVCNACWQPIGEAFDRQRAIAAPKQCTSTDPDGWNCTLRESHEGHHASIGSLPLRFWDNKQEKDHGQG